MSDAYRYAVMKVEKASTMLLLAKTHNEIVLRQHNLIVAMREMEKYH